MDFVYFSDGNLIFVVIYFRREIEHTEERINREWEAKFDQRIKEWKEEGEKRIRDDAIRRSVSSRVGKYMDRLASILTNFEHMIQGMSVGWNILLI